MKLLMILVAGCAIAFGATLALNTGEDARWLAVLEFLVLFAMLSGISLIFKRLKLLKQTVDPILVGVAALLPVLYVSWSVQA